MIKKITFLLLENLHFFLFCRLDLEVLALVEVLAFARRCYSF
jgi:hypothetical protein